MAVFELYANDLTEQAQQSLAKAMGLNCLAEGNYDVFPITTLEFDDVEDEEE